MPQVGGVARLRLSPGEVERLLREERERRKKQRILQVREKAKQLAKNRLESVKREKIKQLEKLAEKIQNEWEVEKQIALEKMEQEYADSIKSIGKAHVQAEEFDLGMEQKAEAAKENERRAEERHRLAIEKLNEDKRIRDAEMSAVMQARQLALAKERIRAQQIASLPPPINSQLNDLLSKAKSSYVQFTDADTYSYPCQLDEERVLVERNENNEADGLLGACEESERRTEMEDQKLNMDCERLEKARVRGIHAIRRERMRRYYSNMMSELDELEKADRKHRQQNLENIPQSLYLPANVVLERESERQINMERKIEDLFCDKHNYTGVTDMRATAPQINYDTTPTVTETIDDSSSCPADYIDPRAPISRVRDTDPDQADIHISPSTTTTTTTESESAESGSQRKRKVAIKKIMKTIQNQKERWADEEVQRVEEDDDDDADCVALPLPLPKSAVTTKEALENHDYNQQDNDETTNGSFSQVTDTTTTTATEQISQSRLTNSEGETTTSSQFIEKQRQELYEYMRSIETQISELEALKKEKKDLDRDVKRTEALEARFGNIGDESTHKTLASDLTADTNLNNTTAGSAYMNELPAEISVSRRPDESVWDWYMRQKQKLNTGIKEKLQLITSPVQTEAASTASARRGYELISEINYPEQPRSYNNVSMLPYKCTAQSKTARTMRDDIRNRQETAERKKWQDGVLETDDYLSKAVELPIPAKKPQYPYGYVTVKDREALLKFDASSVSELNNRMTDDTESSSTTHQHRPTTASVYVTANEDSSNETEDFVSVEERERLIATPLSKLTSSSRPVFKGSDYKQSDTTPHIHVIHQPDAHCKLTRDLDEHAQRLERLQKMMASVRLESAGMNSMSETDRLANSEHVLSRVNAQNQYMTVDEREKLLQTMTRSLLARQPITDSHQPDAAPHPRQHRASWAEVLSESSQRNNNATIEEPASYSWSPLHTQMLNKQQEFNRRQEELRSQLALIQEQKRKLMMATDDRQLLDTQESLRRVYGTLGLPLDADDEDEFQSYSTPSDRRQRPPLSSNLGLSDAEFHELSIIPEMDTPTHLTDTHLTDADTSLYTPIVHSIPKSTNKTEANKTPLPPRTTSSTSPKPAIPAIKVTDVADDDLTPAADITLTDDQAAGYESSEQPDASNLAEDAFDSERAKVLHNLLEQLEIRKAQRSSFLQKEKLTALSSESSGQTSQGEHSLPSKSSPGPVNRTLQSPRIIDLYSSDSNDDMVFAMGAGASTSSSRPSTPSGDTLTEQMKKVNKEWIDQPVPLPSHISQQMTSSDSTSPSSDAIKNGEKQVDYSSTSSMDESIGLKKINQLLQNRSDTSSDPNPSADERDSRSEKSITQYYISDDSSTVQNKLTQVMSPIQSIPSSDQSPQDIVLDQSKDLTAAEVEPLYDVAAVYHDSKSDSFQSVKPEEDTASGQDGKVDPPPQTFSTPNRKPRSASGQLIDDDEETFQTVAGIMEEPEITFASTIPDDITLLEDPFAAAQTLYSTESNINSTDSTGSSNPGMQWVSEEQDVNPDPGLQDVRPKVRTLDSAARKKQQKEMSERTKRLYNQLEEVKEKKAYKAREVRRADSQTRRKEYGLKLQKAKKK